MMLKQIFSIIPIAALVLSTLTGCSSTRTAAGKSGVSIPTDKYLGDAAEQYLVLKQARQAEKFPKTYHADTKTYEWSGSEWWTSGFYPGTLLYLYEETRDTSLYHEALRMLKLLEKEQFNTRTHDLGFMMYTSFGHANRITPKADYTEVLLNSARSLASRFNPAVGCIRSWDSEPDDFLVIIDNMMNLDLLFWATRHTGDSSFYRIGITHANTTLRNHFRPDNSSFHVLNYNPSTGAIKEKRTAQGFSNASAWARGQAWGLYGYVMMYRETGDRKYHEQAKRIAAFILDHPNLPGDKIPFWDFDAPGIPDALRDVSAAAITASALFELSLFEEDKTGNRYFRAAEDMLSVLASPAYRAATGTNGGFILMHGVGHLPAGTEVDVPLTYADYYFVEALSRHRRQLTGSK